MINYIKSPATALAIIFATSGSIGAQGMSISSQGSYSIDTVSSILDNNSNNNDSQKLGRSSLSMCFPMVTHRSGKYEANYILSVDDVIGKMGGILTPNQLKKEARELKIQAEQKERAKKALGLLSIVGLAGFGLRIFLD